MALSDSRIHRGRPTPFPWERKALDQLYELLSDNDPHQAWELHELYDPSSGRLYELDLLLLSRVGLFLVEIKSHPGVLSGDIVDWTFTEPDGRQRRLGCPYPSANHKARVLGSLLERHLGSDRPWVHTAVFVPNATGIRLRGGTPPWLLTPDDARRKLMKGLDDRRPRVVVNKPLMKGLVQTAHRMGLRPSRDARIIGGYQLGPLVDDGEGYQEHLATHPAVESDRARIRSYLVPEATSTERRAQLERAARREAQTLAQLGQHPGILGYRSFVENGVLGPALVFEAFEDGLPLDVFVRQHPDLTFDERLGLLQRIVEAVAHCHRSGVIHRNLSPRSVLVRRNDSGRNEVRLHRFQTASWLEHSSIGTRHLHDLAQTVDRIYQAPEVLSDPDKATFESDAFSIGCLAWLLLTGQHPAADLAARERALARKGPDEEGGLRPSSVRADLAILDEGIAFATRPNLHARPDTVADWFDGWVLDALTRPAVESEPDIDPTQAQKDDQLPGGLKVVRRLGSGGTAIVLQVRREGRTYALKVPHDAGCGDRLVEEAKVLRELRHQHIVALHEVITIGGLPCLLLEYGGERTLADVLRTEGTLSLDLARRYGDDLLSAVQYLEETGVTHRDIKPSNIGFTSQSKKKSHLLLLDLSLAAADPQMVDAGTPAWRDPWLYLRGAWDPAADRWAAAAVLYQALTGARAELKADQRVRLEAERLDAAVRDRLAAFFTRAMAQEPAERFPHAEAMRQAWVHALTESRRAEEATRIDLEQVQGSTPVDALPLSARARNALDRAGVTTAADMLQLPRNQLSVIRGVGSKVAREIIQRADQLRARLQVEQGPVLVPGFVRPRLGLDDPALGLDPEKQAALASAGLTTTVDLAGALRVRAERLVGNEGAQELAQRLQELAAAEPAPGSLEDWLRKLVRRPSDTEADRRLRVLVGLDSFPDERLDDVLPAARSVPDVAIAFGLEPAQVHSSLQYLRKRWAKTEIVRRLSETVSSLLDAHAPGVTFADLGMALAMERDGKDPSASIRATALALVRVALELRPDPPATWRWIGEVPWVARDAASLDAIAGLAQVADDLAALEPLPSIDTVRTALAEAVADTPLGTLPPDQLVVLAARASHRAAASARLELYPRGMSAVRALALSTSTLTGQGLTPEEVQRRVATRYPDAAPVPGRPDLDALLLPHGLVFVRDLGQGEYTRPGVHAHTSLTVQLPPRQPTAQPGLPQRRSPDAQRALAFQDQLDRAVASSAFRVIQVRADLATHATEALGRALGVQPVSVDHALVRVMRGEAQTLGVDWVNVEEADRAGPEGPDWPLLRQLVEMSANELVDTLVQRPGPLLLVWPGALARYDLSTQLARLVDVAGKDAPPVLLVVPSHADGLAPSINGRLPVPAPLPGQRLVMPDAWLGNAHRAAAP